MIDLGRDVPAGNHRGDGSREEYQTGRTECADDDDAEEHGGDHRGCSRRPRRTGRVIARRRSD